MFTVVRRGPQVEEVRPGEFVAEASGIGLSPGEWPLFLALVDGDERQAVGHLFMRGDPDIYRGEIAGYHYAARSGATLLVIND